MTNEKRFYTDYPKKTINGYYPIRDKKDDTGTIWVDCPGRYLDVIVDALNKHESTVYDDEYIKKFEKKYPAVAKAVVNALDEAAEEMGIKKDEPDSKVHSHERTPTVVKTNIGPLLDIIYDLAEKHFHAHHAETEAYLFISCELLIEYELPVGEGTMETPYGKLHIKPSEVILKYIVQIVSMNRLNVTSYNGYKSEKSTIGPHSSD